MHYYQFNIGDYTSHTSHLDPLEDIAYRRMLDWIYLHESPLPENVSQIAKLIRMRDECERITDVLREFFTLTDYGYTQKKAMNEIKRFNDKSEKAKAAVNKRWAKERNKSNTDVLPTNNERNTNHKPITNNHKPIKDIGGKAKRFVPPTPEEVRDYCLERGNSVDPNHFCDFYESKGWMRGKNKIKCWKAAVRTWEKNDKQKPISINTNQRGWSDDMSEVF